MIEQLLTQHGLAQPDSVALTSPSATLSYGQLAHAVSALRQDWATQQRPVAIAVANHPAWVVLDLTALDAQLPLVPLPFFFSDTQLLHALLDAGVNTLITDTPERFCALLGELIVRKSTLIVANRRLMQLTLNVPAKTLPAGTVKITYTSGTTGQPKGVCLGAEAMLNVAASIASAVNIDKASHHLCVLPLATLLENVAGVYATLLAGGTVHLWPSETVGFVGSQLDETLLHAALLNARANTAILIPELLNGLLHALESGAAPLLHLRFLAVGGAKVSRHLLSRAQSLALPVYEGYGLSECASVVTLNTQQSTKIGSVGKPLPHVQIKLADDNELLVKGQRFLGYTNAAMEIKDDWWPTGDIGAIDEHGFVTISGRKKNMFITSFGRNVSPEWVESVLLNAPCIAQACVYGEAKPWNIALVVVKPFTTDKMIEQAITEANQQLPDYALIRAWLSVAPFTQKNQQLTANARLKRAQIWKDYQPHLTELYKDTA